MDLAALAQSAAAYIALLLPYLAKAGEKAAEEAGKRLAGDSWDGTKTLWHSIQRRCHGDPKLTARVEDDLQSSPVSGILVSELQKLFEEDEEAANSWRDIQKSAKPIHRDRSVTIGRDSKHTVIVTGNNNQLGNI